MSTRKATRRHSGSSLRLDTQERKLIRTMRLGAIEIARQQTEDARKAAAEKVFPISRTELVKGIKLVLSRLQVADDGCSTVQSALKQEARSACSGFETVLSECVWSEIDACREMLETLIDQVNGVGDRAAAREEVQS